jgi:hypothetical protein
MAPDGREIAVSFEERERAFQREGTIGGEPLVLAGAVGWRGIATMLHGEADPSRVTLELSADGERLSLLEDGATPIVLARGGSLPAGVDGPFSGRFVATEGRAQHLVGAVIPPCARHFRAPFTCCG